MKKYIVALDQGTTNALRMQINFLIKNENIIGVSQKEFNQIYPREGWLSMIQWKYGQLNIVYFKKLWLSVIYSRKYSSHWNN